MPNLASVNTLVGSAMTTFDLSLDSLNLSDVVKQWNNNKIAYINIRCYKQTTLLESLQWTHDSSTLYSAIYCTIAYGPIQHIMYRTHGLDRNSA